MLLHQDGIPSGSYNECPGIAKPIVDIVRKLDRAVDVVVSGHTHQAYNCVIDGRVVGGSMVLNGKPIDPPRAIGSRYQTISATAATGCGSVIANPRLP